MINEYFLQYVNRECFFPFHHFHSVSASEWINFNGLSVYGNGDCGLSLLSIQLENMDAVHFGSYTFYIYVAKNVFFSFVSLFLQWRATQCFPFLSTEPYSANFSYVNMPSEWKFMCTQKMMLSSHHCKWNGSNREIGNVQQMLMLWISLDSIQKQVRVSSGVRDVILFLHGLKWNQSWHDHNTSLHVFLVRANCMKVFLSFAIQIRVRKPNDVK